MEPTKVAVAMALVVAGLSVGAIPAPTAASSSTNCPQPADFEVPESEPTDSRSLFSGGEEIGIENVSASENDNQLTVELRTIDDEMEWFVYHLDANDDCVEFTAGNCDGPNKLVGLGDQSSCDLPAPSSGTKSYWILNRNLQTSDGLEYADWAPEK